MSYLVFDTETTGLPTGDSKDYKNTAAFDTCRLVSIAFVMYSAEHKELASWHHLVKPEGFQVTATEIHGITHERAESEGKPFSEIYSNVYQLFSQGPMVLGYNIRFDLNVLKSEVWRRDLNMFPDRYKPVCVYKLSKQFNNGNNIRLGAMYKQIFGKELEGWHGAMADARACAEVYQHIIKSVPNEHKDLGIKRVVLKASEVAACIGKNPYKKRLEVLNELWKKYSPSTFMGLTKKEQVLKLVGESNTAQSALLEAMTAKAEQSSDTQDIVKKATEQVNADATLSAGQKRELVDHIRSSVYTSFGTKKEERTSDKVERDEKTKLVRDTSFYEVEVTNICGTRYVIVGTVDRIEEHEDGTRTLVEIKNRTRGLFREVRGYELIQVQTYLQMVQLEKARLVEQYQDEISSNDIPKDQAMWDAVVVPRLVEFCSELHSKMSV